MLPYTGKAVSRTAEKPPKAFPELKEVFP